MTFSVALGASVRIDARTYNDILDVIHEIRDIFSPHGCWNYLRTAAYVSGGRARL